MTVDPSADLSDTDRDRFTGVLGEHYALGRVDDAELARRVEVVLGATTVDEAWAALDGLPALPAAVPQRRRWGRRHGEAPSAQPGWVPTSERFRDPSSGRVMQVWVDARDGSRHYLEDDA